MKTIYFLFTMSLCVLQLTLARAKRPNILFAFEDDWGKYASCYADKNGNEPWQEYIKTPNIDRVAKEGILFNNAFVSSPSCTPCRSSILSGQHFYRTGLGAILIGTWDMNIPTYPLLLEDAGYHIGFSYKCWQPATNPHAGYGGYKNRYNDAGLDFDKFGQNVAQLTQQGKSLEEAKAILYKEVRQNFTDFLNANPGNKPFCYWFGPKNVHRAWELGSGKSQWNIDPDDLKGKLPPFLPDVPDVREDFTDCLGEIQAFDASLGEILKILEERGELNNTFIVVSGDHGIPGFPHGKTNLYDFGAQVSLMVSWPGHIEPNRVLDDFVSLPDLAATFLEAGDVAIPDVMTGKSLMPIFKGKKKNGVQDKNRDHVIIGRERHVPEAREGNLPYPMRAIRTKDYLYIYNFKPERQPVGRPITSAQRAILKAGERLDNTEEPYADMDNGPTKQWLLVNGDKPQYQKYYDFAFGMRPQEELYKIRIDPYQMNNLAQNPEYKKVMQELHRRLMKELKDTEDPRVTGDGTTFDKLPFTRPRKTSK